jgi:hypothetical protein
MVMDIFSVFRLNYGCGSIQLDHFIGITKDDPNQPHKHQKEEHSVAGKLPRGTGA